MEAVIFDIRGSIAHFRRPDTVVTHHSYPFITRTALFGLVSAILGEEDLEGERWFGLRLMNRVSSSFQQVSMLGKGWLGSGPAFNRQTAIELVVDPHYRVHYSGRYTQELAQRIGSGKSVYTTYLGSAFCLTLPKLIRVEKLEEVDYYDEVTTSGVVPAHIIDELIVEPGMQYARCDGVRYRHVEDRVFDGVIDFVYEVSGGPIRFRPRVPLNRESEVPVKLVRGDSGVLCLW
ncbi:MAG: CRISPR-associated protein Cas5 [Bacillota bacterium]|jgi:CRISPR-associated protein Cas5h|nr:CRISPR-associated protein Cas5 [Bacillota bacterium]